MIQGWGLGVAVWGVAVWGVGCMVKGVGIRVQARSTFESESKERFWLRSIDCTVPSKHFHHPLLGGHEA